MEVIGKIIQVLPPQSGTSQAGNQWKKQEYVLETEDAYPRKIHFDFFGDRVDQFPLTLNDRIRLNFDIESREYNGRWYTNIRGWKAEKIDATHATGSATGSSGRRARLHAKFGFRRSAVLSISISQKTLGNFSSRVFASCQKFPTFFLFFHARNHNMKYTYRTEGTCCQAFDIEVENDKIKNIQFYGGCNGNLQGICSLVRDMPIGEVIEKLQGIRCGSKPTSCPDQLSRALKEIQRKNSL